MKLTKQQAIEEHKKMWNWIADNIHLLIDNKQKSICELENLYCEINNIVLIHNCFCCEYSMQQLEYPYSYFFVFDENRCEKCPILWGTEQKTNSYYCMYNGNKYHNIKSGLRNEILYLSESHYKNIKEISKIARQIANLPEKFDINDIPHK